MYEKIISKLIEMKNLEEKETYKMFKMILEGKISDIKTACFLTLLRVKGEQPKEITGAAKLLREKCIKLDVKKKKIADTCGTGGDGTGTFNISTACAILSSSLGIPVAKHGNRSITSKCGSADVMEALGYKIEIPPEKSKKMLEEIDFTFLYAPIYHKAMKNVANVRKELGFRTIFNILGPLCNPCNPEIQIMGVSNYKFLKILPYVFRNLGINGYIFFGEDGIDEITLTGKTYIVEVRNDRIEEFELYPKSIGLKMCKIEDIKGGNAKENAEIIKDIMKGKEKGAKRDIVLLNTSALLMASRKVKNFEEGIEISKKAIKSGIAYKKLCQIIEYSNK
ncbi:MAG: anthranilate phosphoribosyltransferase [Candidatus Omnitrophota bacterium]|nr:MAG: anthranilate phosphoribosyltransferase [Candidatus Omnitrophota bacterium]